MRNYEAMSKDVETCTADEPLAAAAHQMRVRGVGVLPVVAPGGSVVGMLTDRDVLMTQLDHPGTGLDALTVGQAMSRTVHAVFEEDLVAAAIEVMSDHRVRRVPVLDRDGALVGLLSMDDLALAAFQGALHPASVIRAYAAICTPKLMLPSDPPGVRPA